jgi:hypothetical protein
LCKKIHPIWSLCSPHGSDRNREEIRQRLEGLATAKRSYKSLPERITFIVGAERERELGARVVKALRLRVARFITVHDTKTGKNVPNKYKMYQMVLKYPKCL